MQQSEDISWVLDAVIEYTQSKDFRDIISQFIKAEAKEFFAETSSMEKKTASFNRYVALYDSKITELFTNLGLPKSQITPAWNFILQSEEGISDTRMASEFLSAEKFDIFALLMNYHYLKNNFIAMRADSSAKPQQLVYAENEAALAEIKLALSLSKEIEKRIASSPHHPVGKTGTLTQLPPPPYSTPSGTVSSATISSGEKSMTVNVSFPPPPIAGSAATPVYSQGSSLNQSTFSVTGTPIPKNAGQKHTLTPASIEMVSERNKKLSELEASVSSQLEEIRKQQEQEVLDQGDSLAEKMKKKREASLAAQKKA
ncbi:hypothetical protein BLNAU_16119 [Blattamonas nauphoetae]|uniref:BART domain-containing protein n=2 Tax=Blattamonas nauphoetae TaxID=2049346 RepID=A0ABQ9XAE5_9EUKA|nr:hypothetical protein BLNAU_16119 [Blattamonas nauphoetae]